MRLDPFESWAREPSVKEKDNKIKGIDFLTSEIERSARGTSWRMSLEKDAEQIIRKRGGKKEGKKKKKKKTND